MIGIVDYGMGNLRSVQKAFEHLGASATVLGGGDGLAAADVSHLVLPGVGAFADGMAHLRERRWLEPIRDFVASGRPFLGICLGMQLLFEGSQEDAAPGKFVPGLGMLAGQVVQFHTQVDGHRVKVPHMGWNTLAWSDDKPADPLLEGLEQGAAVYFVHGYYVPLNEATRTEAIAVAEYPAGKPFCAAVRRGQIWATQFHPEKSQRVGLRMLANFAAASHAAPLTG